MIHSPHDSEPTPRTDEVAFERLGYKQDEGRVQVVNADFARSLERSLAHRDKLLRACLGEALGQRLRERIERELKGQ